MNPTKSKWEETWPLDSRSSLEKWCDDDSGARARVFGYWMNVDTKDESITKWLVKEGYWEAWISLAIARWLDAHPGSWCVDAGANVGYYSLLMKRLGAERVLAVEPHPHTASLLRRTVEENKIVGLDVCEVGLGDVSSRAELLRFGGFHGSDSFFSSEGYEVTERTEVSVTPLDVLLVNWPRLDFMKVDVEGCEQSVWRGMQFLRKRFRPTICMEVRKRPDFDLEEFLIELASERHVGFVDFDGSIVPTDPSTTMRRMERMKTGWEMLWLT